MPLIKLDNKDGKGSSHAGGASGTPEPNLKIENVTLAGKRLRIDVEPSPGTHYFFEGELGAGKVLGAYVGSGFVFPAYLAKTAMNTSG